MVALTRGEKPKKLTDQLVEELTEKFKKDKKLRVWDRVSIKNALLEFSYNKCCYCETMIKEESKYLTVDHFHHKDNYPDEVVSWDNLLPACSRCNSNKGVYDTYKSPIIDPTKDNPKNFLYFHNFRYKSINNNTIGDDTIKVLYLNDSSHAVLPRFKVGEAIQEKLDDILDKANTYDNKDVKTRNKIVCGIKGLLAQADISQEYSAVIATTIIEDDNYYKLKEKMIHFGLWDNELKQLEINASSICLSKTKG